MECLGPTSGKKEVIKVEKMEEIITVNGQAMPKEKLTEIKQNLKKDELLKEVSPNEYRVLKRLKE